MAPRKSTGRSYHGQSGVSVGSGHDEERRAGVLGSDFGGVFRSLDVEELEAKRASLVTARQAELESVLDRHDSLVREAFHMEKFVTLISYNPKEAKEDQSPVFREYKAQYDLLEKANQSAGPSRKTRRAHTERLGFLKGPSATPSSSSLMKKSKHAKPPVDRPADLEIWDILAQAKSKGKATPKSVNGTEVDGGKGGKRTAEGWLGQAANGVSRTGYHDAISSSIHVAARPPRETGLVTSGADASHPRPRNRRRTEPIEATPSLLMPPPSERPTRSSTRIIPIPLSPLRPDLSFVSNTNHSIPKTGFHSQPQLKPAIRRVKLIVRRPPPSFSSPLQRPPVPRHGNSLDKFLSSYNMLDQEDLASETLESMAKADATIWSRYDDLRGDVKTMGFDPIEASAPRPDTGGRTDPWSDIVATIIARSRLRYTDGRQIASYVAGKVANYWEGQATRDDKARAQEEKRLRALAKATIKHIASEWKRAVFHIREQQRLQQEAEDKRRGREHLDAILNQSGQILEAQHVELSRAEVSRSQSRSSASPFPDNESDFEGSEAATEPLETGIEEEEEDTDAEPEYIDYEMSIGEGGDGEEFSTSALLSFTGENFGTSASSPSESRAPSEIDNETFRPMLEDTMQFTTSPMSFQPTRLGSTPSDSVSGSLRYPSSSDGFDDETMSPLFDYLDTALHSPKQSLPIPLHDPEPECGSVRPSDGDRCHASHTSSLLQSHTNGGAEVVDGEDLQIPLPVVEKQSMESLGWTNPQDEAMNMSSPPHHHFVSPAPDETDLAPSPSLAEEAQGDQAFINKAAPAAFEGVHDARLQGEADVEEGEADAEVEEDDRIPAYLKPFAVAPVDWDSQDKIKPPLLLRGSLRPYQHSGLEWLASLHVNNLNGILADEMGLGKTIQTIALLAHLACDRGIWGPHLIIVPTSVILNWEMEFKKFLPGFKVLSYHGTTKRRKELRQGWNNKYHFNVCITSYTLASRDAHIFKRKPWYYMILDEAHMIKNFKSQRWNILLMFRSFRRLLLTGTPLQNNLTELWALLQFLMSGTNFANVKEFGEWFSNPLEKAIEMGSVLDDETQQRVSKLHTVLRPYLLRRLKRDVEKELPSKYEHLVLCPLSKRQRFLYDEFMSRRQTRDDLHSGVYQKVANILMQLRKVCNHPDLFEVRSIVTSFAVPRSVAADFEIKDLLVRRRMMQDVDEDCVDLDFLGLQFINRQKKSIVASMETCRLDASSRLPFITELPGEPPPYDARTIDGFKSWRSYQLRAATIARWSHFAYLNRLRCAQSPIYSQELVSTVGQLYSSPLSPTGPDHQAKHLETSNCLSTAVCTYAARAQIMSDIIDRFAFATPPVVALDLPRIAMAGCGDVTNSVALNVEFDEVLHRASVKLQIAFPDPSLLQYDCGKLQQLDLLLKERKAGGHRILIFTQMTKILDILEIFLSFHGYLYLRLDGATKIEDRQYITERFNADPKVFCFISSSRSGGVGINLTGADTVIFYDSDFNPQMDRQCEDRAHRIGQIRDVHIYRFISQHTVEEALLRKANQKRSLDDIVIQQGEFDWRSLFGEDQQSALTRAMGEFEDREDAHAAAVAAREEIEMVGADEVDFGGPEGVEAVSSIAVPSPAAEQEVNIHGDEVVNNEIAAHDDLEEHDQEDGGTAVDYMLSFVQSDWEFFKDWRL
ncbi:hypothetical protein JAAARDRAFT_311064 [Jaapia argillacea MUCL 33604]|uniref:DNA helicase n=1 Tax=Jaapia argillacea MUCL 33604 TaxID=933084 RepID=A0A067PNL9_9AGAM|nr:hypothetical protein JAAARDRAFT_311064 [Jaapia argillacea MUCL 33604]